MIIDAHVHVWSDDPGRYPWQPTFGYVPEHPASLDVLLTSMDARGVDRALLVQPSVYGDDHRFVLDSVAAHPDRFWAIGQVEPANAGAVDNARRLVDEDGAVGLRVLLAADPDRAREQVASPAWTGLVATGVPISLRAMPVHHGLVVELLGRHPETAFVLDHLGIPDLADAADAAGRVAELASYENCHMKVAGFAHLRAASGTAESGQQVASVVRACLAGFGPARLAWGSDFPGADHRTVQELALDELAAMPFLDGAALGQILGGTAVRLWGLRSTVSTPEGI